VTDETSYSRRKSSKKGSTVESSGMSLADALAALGTRREFSQAKGEPPTEASVKNATEADVACTLEVAGV